MASFKRSTIRLGAEVINPCKKMERIVRRKKNKLFCVSRLATAKRNDGHIDTRDGLKHEQRNKS